MNFFTKSFRALLLVVLIQQIGFSQTCPTSSIVVSSNTTICSGSCANLTSTVTALRRTTTYSDAATPYTPFPYGVGTTAIPNVDDVWSAAIPIGFNFCFFGNTFTNLLIGSNGEITFNTAVASGG